MLEEIKFDYKITEINLSKGEQFNLDFRKISPLSKIPAITDHKNKVSIFQSCAILIYLAELSGKSEFGEERYFNIAKRLYKDLDEHLSKSDYLAGKEYSIADIATFPWIARHDWHDIGLKKFKNLSAWYEVVSKREAVIKGYDCLDKGEKIPTI